MATSAAALSFPSSSASSTIPSSSAYGRSSAAVTSVAGHGRRGPKVVCAVGELSSGSTNYLIAGAIGIALIGTAFPIFFSRKDLCPECDGAGFVRKSGEKLTANAARKDNTQIVCRRCNGLGKLAQVDK